MAGFGDPLPGAERHAEEHTSTAFRAGCDSGERTSEAEPLGEAHFLHGTAVQAQERPSTACEQ
eukprot:3998525-Alexandrium_andersonii.AAC.1